MLSISTTKHRGYDELQAYVYKPKMNKTNSLSFFGLHKKKVKTKQLLLLFIHFYFTRDTALQEEAETKIPRQAFNTYHTAYIHI